MRLRNTAYKSFQPTIYSKEGDVVHPCVKDCRCACLKVPRREKDPEGNRKIRRNKGNQEQRKCNLEGKERDKGARCGMQFLFVWLLGTS